jgi:hypothetical protein
MSSTNTEGLWSEPVLTVIGAPTTMVDAQSISRLAVWPSRSDPHFMLQPGSFVGPAESDWTILAGTTATGTRVIPAAGHHTWQDYHLLPGHVWCPSSQEGRL